MIYYQSYFLNLFAMTYYSFNLSDYIPLTWKHYIAQLYKHKSFRSMSEFLKKEYKNDCCIYPNKKDIFKALELTTPKKVKVVILGQDPYINAGQANGLAFSVAKHIPLPPSLKNIFFELKKDITTTVLKHGDLTSWAQQGILLLNTVLTVRDKQSASHRNQGWEEFTQGVIQRLNQDLNNIIFVLWGNDAKKLKKVINLKKNFVLEAAHPSPLSAYRGFFGCRHFSQINQLLLNMNKQPINWQLI